MRPEFKSFHCVFSDLKNDGREWVKYENFDPWAAIAEGIGWVSWSFTDGPMRKMVKVVLECKSHGKEFLWNRFLWKSEPEHIQFFLLQSWVLKSIGRKNKLTLKSISTDIMTRKNYN